MIGGVENAPSYRNNLIRVPRLRTARLGVPLILFALALTGCNRPDVKLEEKRILSEINQLSEESRIRISSDEARAHMVRLNGLTPLFPERRDEIASEAEAVKAHFTRAIEDDKKLVELWRELLALSLSHSYRNCVIAQVEIHELVTEQSQKVIEEMDLLLDRSVSDRQAYDGKLAAIRSTKDERFQKLSERESYLDQNCRQPRDQ